MRYRVLTVGPVATNCYILYGDDAFAVAVDPGAEGGAIAAYVKSLGLEIKQIWLTHGHFDHICGAAELKKAFSASAFETFYEGIGSVNGEQPLPFTSRYPDEQSYLTGWEKVAGGEVIGLQGEEWQWLDEQAGLMMGVTLYSTLGGTRYNWEVQNYDGYQEYLYTRVFSES